MNGTGPMLLAYAFMLVFARLASLAMAAPAFLPPSTPTRVRTAALTALAGVMVAALPTLPALDRPYLALLLEIMLGLVMGLTLRLAAVSLGFAAELVDLHAGFSFSQLVDPMTQIQSGPVARLLQAAAGLLFVVGGGHVMVIRGLARSLEVLPPGGLAFAPATALALSSRLGDAYAAGLRLAAPLLGALLAMQLILAFVSRVAPQLNVWGIGLGVTCGLVGVGLYLYLPALAAEMDRLSRAGIAQMGHAWGGARG